MNEIALHDPLLFKLPVGTVTKGTEVTFCIEVKEDAKHVGGVNIFGKKFGDYPQGIIMNITYE